MSDLVPVTARFDVPPGQGTEVTAGRALPAEPTIGSDVPASHHDQKVVAAQVFVRLAGTP